MQATPATPDRRPGGAVGHLLREWRAARGMSQLDLAMRAGFSARHVSFIETGRTQPAGALLVLAETLEVPLRERNGCSRPAALPASTIRPHWPPKR